MAFAGACQRNPGPSFGALAKALGTLTTFLVTSFYAFADPKQPPKKPLKRNPQTTSSSQPKLYLGRIYLDEVPAKVRRPGSRVYHTRVSRFGTRVNTYTHWSTEGDTPVPGVPKTRACLGPDTGPGYIRGPGIPGYTY